MGELHGQIKTYKDKISWRQKTHKAINNQFLKRLNIVAEDFFEMELVKSTVEHREPIIVGFFILQNAKLRLLELYYNFFDKFCDVKKFEELEMDTDSLYLALAEEDLDNCILPSPSQQASRMDSCRFLSLLILNFVFK